MNYSYVSGNSLGLRKPNGKAQSISKHRYIWIKAYGSIPKGYIIHHKDGNKNNNCLDNLEMIIRSKHTTIHLSFKGGNK